MVDRIKAWLIEELASGPFMVAIRWKDGTTENLLHIEDAAALDDDAQFIADNMPFPSMGVITDVR